MPADLPLVAEATALTGPAPGLPRPDQLPAWDSRPGALAQAARHATAAELVGLLQASRADTLATAAAWQAALPALRVPCQAELNPPLWELGHIGWFQTWWLGRHPAWWQGVRADPMVLRRPAGRAGADSLYDSSRVPHDSRWQLPLPSGDDTLADLAAGLDQTLSLLDRLLDRLRAEPAGQAGAQDGAAPDAALYLFRLALFHEDMHHEAALYMARALGVPVGDARWQHRPLPDPGPALSLPPATWCLGVPGPLAGEPGFVFDNECGQLTQSLPGTEIDAQVLRWADYLPFVEAGGYRDPRWWTPPGWAWLQRAPQREGWGGWQRGHPPGPAQAPRYLRREGAAWQHWLHGQWQPLNPACAAVHLSQHEALAWCRWAGRRLPTEAEWAQAAAAGPAFQWGAVWEWTSSAHQAWPGFQPHPYREYAAPWMDGRPVLRGASALTQPRMRHPAYRNFFPADRNDVPAGFRSCAL